MKRSVKLGLALLVVGALVFSLGFFGSGMDLGAMNGDLGPISVRVGTRRGFGGSRGGTDSDGSYAARQSSFDAAELRRIVLREDNAAVTVTLSPDDQVHLLWQESSDDPMAISNSGGTLQIDRKTRFGIFFLWGLWDTELHTELQIPKNLAAALDVASDNGAVEAAGLTLAGNAEFSSSNGNVSVKDLSAADLTLKNSNGAVTADGVACAGAVLTNSNGIVRAADLDCASLEAQASNGRITLTDVSAGTALFAKTSNGAVEVENAAAGESIELRSSNGAVRGTLAGSSDDYYIESGTSNGSNNLPNGWGRGAIRLTVHTGNGSIDIRFAED